jgi:hypothetical protein
MPKIFRLITRSRTLYGSALSMKCRKGTTEDYNTHIIS